jgi:hypothetical protein
LDFPMRQFELLLGIQCKPKIVITKRKQFNPFKLVTPGLCLCDKLSYHSNCCWYVSLHIGGVHKC